MTGTLSEYKNMWIFAMFDLPVVEKEDRKQYTRFRNFLLSEGFIMLQFSVYAKFCSSRVYGDTELKHIKEALPSDGQIRLVMITDKQFGEMFVFHGKIRKKSEDPPEQLMLL